MRHAVQAAFFIGLWLAVFPVFGINHFLHTRFEHSVEIFALFDQDIFAFAAVFAVQVDDGVGSCAATGEVVED